MLKIVILDLYFNLNILSSWFIDSENSNGSVKEGFWRDIIRREGVAGLQEIGNVRGSRYQQNALGQREAYE